MKINFIDLGLRRFEEVQLFQKIFLEKIKNNTSNEVILLSQFYPVITLGRKAKIEDILIDKEKLEKENISIFSINRGGGVTIHIPGQWVIYPILNLANWKKDISFYLNLLHNWIVYFLSLFGIEARADKNLPGVWVKDKKICFIGIGISRWITFHGLSINIDPDLKFFSYINPCGIKKLKVTSLKEEILYLPPEEKIKENLLKAWEAVIRKEGFLYELAYTSSLVGQTFL